jgi:DNA-binding beta-propeller fold protein YncE
MVGAVAILATALAAGIASAVTGQLSFQGCFADTAAAGCSVPVVAALDGAHGVAASPDNKSVYVTSQGDNSISHFTRDPATGNLGFQGCLALSAATGCSSPAQAALDGPVGVAVSPDNKSVYVASRFGSSISHLIRDPATGNLSFQGCFSDTGAGGCAVPAQAALDGALAVAVSADAKSVYVASLNDHSISSFTRDPTTGGLSFQGCFADTGAAGCAVPAQAALNEAFDVALSADGKSVYVASHGDDSISSFTRDPTTGGLSFQGCFADTPAAGCAVPAQPALDGAQAVAASADGTSVYAVSEIESSISQFIRDPVSGNLSFQGCFSDTGAAGCVVPAQPVLGNAQELAVSPDSKSVYVAALEDAISHFTRDPATGGLSFQGCFADTAVAGCSVPAQAALDDPIAVAVSADSASVFAASRLDDSISYFSREVPPPPPPPSTSTPGTCHGKTASLTGTAGGEVIRGTGKRDVVAGLGGNDRILGRGGKDLICAAGGNDRLIGGGGGDSLIGGGGRDKLIGGGGTDKCKGGAGKDKVRGCE